jgi:hypothetical protein
MMKFSARQVLVNACRGREPGDFLEWNVMGLGLHGANAKGGNATASVLPPFAETE